MNDFVRRELSFAQSPTDVWRALTDPKELAEWILPNDFSPKVGHRFTFRGEPNPKANWDGIVHCEVLKIDEPNTLQYSWAGAGVDTVVTFSLEPDGTGTTLHFEQTGFDSTQPWSQQAISGAEFGWTKMFEALEKLLGA